MRRRGEDPDDGGDEESESGSDSEKALNEPSKNAICNGEALLEKLEDIAWPENAERVCQGGRAMMMRWIWVLMRRRDSRNQIRGGRRWLPAIDPEGGREGREARRRIRSVGSAETRSLGTEVGKV